MDIFLSYKDLIKQTDIQIAHINEELERLKSKDIPIGLIVPYGGETIPSGWLECNGMAVNRVVYAQLFSVIGTIYGAGDGSTTFNLPNISGKTLVGQSSIDTDFDTIGEMGGEKTHTLSVTEMPSHTHGTAYVNIPNGSGSRNAMQSIYWGPTDSTFYTNSAGGSGAHNNMPPYMVTKFIIKATSGSGEEPVAPTIEQRLAAIEGQLSRVENYTTQEQLIGTWLDGKPLYRKFVDYGALPNATSATRAHSISNVKHIHINQGKTFWVPNGSSYTDNSAYSYITPYSGYVTNMAVNKTEIYIATTIGDATNYKILVCLEYTKTTD